MNATTQPEDPPHGQPPLQRVLPFPETAPTRTVPAPDDERDGWRGVRQGDRAAYERLYRRYARLLLHYGRRFTPDDDLLWDAIHDVFADVWKYQAALNPDAHPQFYLMRSLRNRLSQYQKNAFLPDEFLTEPDPDPSLETQLIGQEADEEKLRRLAAAIERLPERQRQVLRLRFFDDLSYDQITARLNVSKQVVYNHVHKAMETLRANLTFAWALLGFWW
mgnify:FL=1